MSKVTLKILAKQLNLSTAAVSKALRDSHEISEVTKKRVISLANELAYVPHPYAGSLREKRSKTIAVVIPEVADSFFSLALNGIEAIAIQKGYHALIYLTHESVDREIQILKDLEFGRVDGVLMSITMKTTSFEHIKALNHKIPLVFFDRVCDEVDTAKITTNDYECGYQATQHLIDCGCKRISILTISNSLSISSKRMNGYLQALEDNGIPYEPELNISYGDDSEKNHELITALMSKPDRPDGILATVSKMTMDIYLVAMELGINIPQELKVVCFSNESTAAILNPSLTTITQPAFDIGKQAATILFKALEKKYLILSEESIVIPSSLIVRRSTIA
ncbi:substrate-binding domain-containing protein [Pedobacter sp. LMG 31464]|uniref:Substrate-binding domain-containing protein n=1 Tax=Pedobacter planticolens TaxID=2679964 RepID=A0A923DVW1_9SPHI|nr:LacI family DNA-binding transcriptional regulator [Pedobacter planticolens]MBB2144902.1 substrate-binding domain-containing protein [Pedobacter planticolens]